MLDRRQLFAAGAAAAGLGIVGTARGHDERAKVALRAAHIPDVHITKDRVATEVERRRVRLPAAIRPDRFLRRRHLRIPLHRLRLEGPQMEREGIEGVTTIGRETIVERGGGPMHVESR